MGVPERIAPTPGPGSDNPRVEAAALVIAHADGYEGSDVVPSDAYRHQARKVLAAADHARGAVSAEEHERVERDLDHEARSHQETHERWIAERARAEAAEQERDRLREQLNMAKLRADRAEDAHDASG